MVLSFLSTIGVFIILFIIKEHIAVKGETRVQATAPLQLVKEGGILSLHCQIWKASATQDVSISRRSPGELIETKISLRKKIIPDDRNYFLAHRKLKDGSDVYFLSITDATREDEGEYFCSLHKMVGWGIDKEESVLIEIRYFPSESFPVCDPTGPQSIMEGESMILNCTSDTGKPTVSMNWTRTGSTEKLLQTAVIKDKSIYSEFSFKAQMRHKDAMFVCTIKSKSFTTTSSDQKCHVGPFTILRNPDISWPLTTVYTPIRVTEPKYTLLTNQTDDDECHEICAEMTAESVFRWTIATVIAGLLALVFFVFGIVLLIRYCFALDEQRVPPEEELNDMPDMSNVQYRIDGSRLYMTLERPSTSQTEVVYQGGEVLERQYILAPSRAGEFDQSDGSYIGTPHLRDSELPYQRTPIRRDSYTQSTDSPVKCIELDKESMDNTTMSDDLDRPSYQGTPVRNGGASISLQGTPTHRVLMDKVLIEAQSEGFIGTPVRRESEGYIGPASSRGDSGYLYGTPSRGDYNDRQRCLTPTLPPRRYKTHYV